MPSSSTVLAAAIQRVCKAAEGWRFHYSKALLMLCIVHGSAVQSLILSHCSLPPLGEVLLQEAYPLGLSCWEPEALELFLNLLPQLQQKHLTFLSKSILGSFLLFFLRTYVYTTASLPSSSKAQAESATLDHSGGNSVRLSTAGLQAGQSCTIQPHSPAIPGLMLTYFPMP